jgi:hypothetical protein
VKVDFDSNKNFIFYMNRFGKATLDSPQSLYSQWGLIPRPLGRLKLATLYKKAF